MGGEKNFCCCCCCCCCFGVTVSAYVTCLALDRDRDRSLTSLLLSLMILFLTGQTEARVLCLPSQLMHFGGDSVQLFWEWPFLAQKVQIDCFSISQEWVL